MHEYVCKVSLFPITSLCLRKVMYAWLKEQGENPHGRGPSPLKDQAAGSQPGATASQGSPPPPHIEGLVMKILAPYISSSGKGKCVLGLLLRCDVYTYAYMYMYV